MKGNTRQLVPIEIDILIREIRSQKVILDSDLARIYGVPTKALNQAVKRNRARFPDDFCFRLSAGEIETLNRSQIVTGSQKHRDPRFEPYVFTEHGAIMAANVLNSPRATQMSVLPRVYKGATRLPRHAALVGRQRHANPDRLARTLAPPAPGCTRRCSIHAPLGIAAF